MKKGISTIWAVMITVVVMAGVATVGWYYLNQQQVNDQEALNEQIDDLQSQVASLKNKNSSNTSDASASTVTDFNSNSATTDPYLYTNTKYKFSLTFNALWKGYSMKEAKVDGETATLYICMSSTDQEWMSHIDASEPSSCSIAAIGIFSEAEWADYQAQVAAGAPEQITKIGKSGNYTIGYSHAQDYPDDLSATANNISTVATTFKAL